MLVCEYKESKLIKGLKIYKKQINKQRRKKGRPRGLYEGVGYRRLYLYKLGCWIFKYGRLDIWTNL